MSSYEGLTQLNDHHRMYGFNALHQRSDSVESHGSISSLSSNHSSVGCRNNGVPSAGASETSRFRRADPPRTLNTGGSPMRNQTSRDLKHRSLQPQVALLHSTSVMEAPSWQQPLNRSRSGSCPMVWAANGSLREHPLDRSKQRHLQANSAAYSPFAYSLRQPERPLSGQVTGSVQYVGSQHDDCRALGGARMPQGSDFPVPNRHLGYAVYNGFETHERYPSEQSLADFAQSPSSGISLPNQRSRMSAYAAGRTGERCPSEQNLTGLVQSPSVVSSLQRSLSTMSVNVVPNSNFTSKLKCNLSQSYTSKLNDVSQKMDERAGGLRKDSRNGKQNILSPRSPHEMGLSFNVPQTGHVRRQREAFEKEAASSVVKPESSLSQKNASFGPRGQFKHRSFENLSPASKKYSLGNAFAFGESKREDSVGDSKRNARLDAWTPNGNKNNIWMNAPDPSGVKSNCNLNALTPSEIKRNSSLNALTPNEVKRDSSLNALTPNEVKRNSRMSNFEKRDSLEHTLTPNENKRGHQLHVEAPSSNKTNSKIPVSRSARSNQVNPLTTRENCNKRPSDLLKSMEIKPDSQTHVAPLPGCKSNRHLHACNAHEPSSDSSPSTASSSDKCWNFSRNSLKSSQRTNGSLTSLRSLFTTAISDADPRTPEITPSQPSSAQPSTYVSEVYVSIVKPRPSSGHPRERVVSLQPSINSPSVSSPIYDNLLVNLSPSSSSASRSSLPLAVTGSGRAADERAPATAATAATASARRHSNPTEKLTEMSPGIRAHLASQKEQLKGLLSDVNSLHLHRDNLRTCVAQLEKETQEKRRVTNDHFPTAYELERFYEINRQLKIGVQQLSHEIDRLRSRESRSKMRREETEVDSWSCSACTFINHPALNRCECCDLPKLSFVMR